MPFINRPPSAQWESLPIQRIPGLALWVWNRPQHLPAGLLVRVPNELLMAYPTGFPFTLADVLMSAGVEPGAVHSVALFGGPWQTAADMAAYLNVGIPPVMPGAVPEIAIQVAEQPTSDANAGAPAGTEQSGSSTEPPAADAVSTSPQNSLPEKTQMMYDRIATAWRVSLQMERQMAGLRQKLASMLNTLGKLDRDLHPDERLAAAREDRDAWHDARRWLRDLGAKCHREIKTFDIGMTSAAGRRNSMEQIYRQIIEPRVATSDLPEISREFEIYRKDMMNLQRSMQTALQTAAQNGTQRATRVLGVIGRKVRERRAKMREPIGGTNLDRSVRRKS